MGTFFIADTHFNDADIFKYENRPFASVGDMNEQLVKRWNATIHPDDVVFHLGDVGDLSFIKNLNGTKYLIKGNHDNRFDGEYIKAGFEEVYSFPIILEDFYMLSHAPLYVSANMPYANIFGHVHNNPIYKSYSEQHFCVSVERIKYTPISFSDIKKTFFDLRKD